MDIIKGQELVLPFPQNSKKQTQIWNYVLSRLGGKRLEGMFTNVFRTSHGRPWESGKTVRWIVADRNAPDKLRCDNLPLAHSW